MLKPKLFIYPAIAMVSALLLSIPVAQADEDGPNPGDDNPGSTTVTLDFFIGANLALENGCFETSEWCTEQFLDASVAVETKGKGKHAVTASASAYAALGCEAAARADAGASVWFEGGGELSLTRHGNHGAMHHIKFDAALTSGAVTMASADASASAWAETNAWVFAEASSWEDACTSIEIVDLVLAEFCADALADASSESLATAHASSFAGSGALAESGSFGAVTSYTEVWAANIEEFHAAVGTAAGSFAAADATAFADASAESFTDAYAEAFAEACSSIEILDIFDEVCNDGWAAAEAHAAAFAYAYAEGHAEAFANADVEVYLPATYINENGIYDTISFGPEADFAASVGIDWSCDVPEEPEAD
jgi:hypothetical protein